MIPAVLVPGAVLVLAVADVVKEQASNNWYIMVAAATAVVVQLSFAFNKLAMRLIRKLLGWISGGGRVMVSGVMAAVLLVVAATVLILRLTTDKDCPHTTELRILTSAEGLESVREVTRAYARSTADSDGCPAVFPYVYAAGTSAVSGALARGWVDTRTEHPLIDLGPRPDVWLPDSMVDVRQVRDILAKTLPRTLTANGRLPAPLSSATSIGLSPIVLAGSAATTDETATLPALVGTMMGQKQPTLAAADPESSAAGLLAAAGYLLDDRTGLVDQAEARRREQIIAGTTPSGTDEVGLLCSYLRRQQAPVAVLTSLRTWRRLIAGKSIGADCPAAPAPPGAGNAPQAVVEGPALDFPFVRFTWTSSRPAKAADDLLAWLLSGKARPQLSQAGLDPPLAGCGTLERNACVPIALDAMLDVHRQAKLPGQVLLAVDTSGSMNQRTGAGGTTRFTVASQGVVEALGHLGPHDEFGLWTFPAQPGRRSPELVGLDAGTLPHRTAIAGALKTVKPAGATPLYSTILTGLDKVAAGGAGKRIRALVVLTDGEDSARERTLPQMAAEVRKRAGASGARLYVIATGDASCENAGGTKGLRLLTDAARGQCLDTSPGEADETMAQLFTTLWGGR